MKPSVGRIVHYVSRDSDCRAAIITGTDTTSDLLVSLAAFKPSGLHFVSAIHDENDKTAGTWHWPERVE